jgi:hypothetical protein
MYQILTYPVNQKGVSYTQIKLLNALPWSIKICRNDTKGLKPVFKEYSRANFFYCQREFTSIYMKCTWFLTSAVMYIKYLYSMLRNITAQRRPQKHTFSSTRLCWWGFETFF